MYNTHAYMIIIEVSYEKKDLTVMVNNPTKIIKTDNHLSPQIIEHTKKEDMYIWCWKSRFWFGHAQKCDSTSVNGIPTLLIIGSTMTFHI